MFNFKFFLNFLHFITGFEFPTNLTRFRLRQRINLNFHMIFIFQISIINKHPGNFLRLIKKVN